MTPLSSPLIWLGALSTTVGLLIAALAWRQRDTRGALTYAALMTVLAVWSSLYVVQLLQGNLATKRPWLVARHGLTPLVAALFWVFVAKYTDRDDLLAIRFVGPIAAAGVVLAAVAVSNPAGLYWRGLSLFTAAQVPRVVIKIGPGGWLMHLYVFLVVGGGHGYLVATLLDSFSVYRRQLAAMAVVGGIEFGLMALFLSEHLGFAPDLNPWPHVQLITYNMVFVAAPLGWSYLEQSLFTLQVLDHQTVIDNMQDAVFVFDTDDILRSVNEAGVALVDDKDELQGRSAAAVFDESPVLLDAYRRQRGGNSTTTASTNGGGRSASPVPDRTTSPSAGIADAGQGVSAPVELGVNGGIRWYDIRISAIRDSAGKRTGTVVVARNVTLQQRQRRELNERTAELERKTERLQRQNDRLDRFASVVSHDLRNPLHVADGRLELARAECESEHLDGVSEAHARMETMIDDLLTLARTGQGVDATESVSLASSASEAWENAQVSDCDLELRISDRHTVQADRALLLNVFENLYRNAADHNPTPVTVRVGLLSPSKTGPGHGFYVEDDGSGIPASEQDDVFDHGYTTTDGGTGFGLAIVADIVEAHGWSVRATTGSSGGARFEVTGIDLDGDR